MTSHPSRKKQKLVHVNVEKSTFELLLQQNWFLIELGRKLIGVGDYDLLNILVLNKKINQRATPIFKQHFFNKILQKQVIESIFNFQFDQVQSLFEKHSVALNPNITSPQYSFFDPNNAQKFEQCTHQKYFEEFEFNGNCGCLTDLSDEESYPHLIVLAMRLKLNSLVRAILFHHRLDFSSILNDELKEIFDWAVMNGEKDSMFFILEKGINRLIQQQKLTHEIEDNNNFFDNTDFDLSFAVAASIRFDRFDIFLEIMSWKLQGIPKIILNSDECLLSICVEKGEEKGLKYYEIILNSKMVNFHDRPDTFIETITKHGGEYFKIALKAWIKRSPVWKSEDIDFLQAEIVVNYVKENFENKTEMNDLLLKFGVATMKVQNVHRIFDIEKYIDLLDVFQVWQLKQNPITKFLACALILDKLNPKAKILPIHVERLLLACIQHHRGTGWFSLVWDDKRLEKTTEMTLKLILRATRFNNQPIISLLLPLVSKSDLVEYNLGKKRSPEIVRTTLQNCIWLEEFKKCLNLNDVQSTYEFQNIEMTEELFDLTLKVFVNDISCVNYKAPYMLEMPSVKQEWWTQNRKHLLLLRICKSPILHFELRYFNEKFPNYDFSRNDNEALRVFLESEHYAQGVNARNTRENCEFLSERIQFSSQFQKIEFVDLAKLNREFNLDFVPILEKIKVAEKFK